MTLDRSEALQLARHYARVIYDNRNSLYCSEDRDEFRRWGARMVEFLDEYERLEAENKSLLAMENGVSA